MWNIAAYRQHYCSTVPPYSIRRQPTRAQPSKVKLVLPSMLPHKSNLEVALRKVGVDMQLCHVDAVPNFACAIFPSLRSFSGDPALLRELLAKEVVPTPGVDQPSHLLCAPEQQLEARS